MAGTEGGVSLDVTPDARDFWRKLDAQLKPGAKGAGDNVANTLAKAIGGAGSSAGRDLARQLKTALNAELKGYRPTVNVGADTRAAKTQIAALKREASALDGQRLSIRADADTAAAMTKLAALKREVDGLDGKRVKINASADASGAAAAGSGLLQTVALWTAAASAAVPVTATLGAGFIALGGALGAAGLGFGGLAAVAIPSLTRIKAALDAQSKAQKNSAATALAAQTQASAEASAQAALASAVREAGQAHQQALDQVRTAEQQLTSAQISATDAQRALTQARIDARQHEQDLANSVIDAGLAVRRDELNVESARIALQKLTTAQQDALKVQQARTALAQAQAGQKVVLGDPNATDTAKTTSAAQVAQAQAAVKAAQDQAKANDLARKQAKLAYDEAVQQLKEQQLQLKRLTAEQKAAAKAGVEGSDQVRRARQALAQANQQLENSELALGRARQNVGRVDQQSAERITAARRALNDTTARSALAESKLVDATTKLSPAAQDLVKHWKALTDEYKRWNTALEPEVLPLFSKGIDIVRANLPLLTPIVHAASGAVSGLLDDAARTAGSPVWRHLIGDLTATIPTAITSLGHSALNVSTGIAGIFDAFLPEAPVVLRWIEQLTEKFAAWGANLRNSAQFADFMAYVRQNAPEIEHDVAELAKALGHVVMALAGLGPGALTGIGLLAELVGKMPPDQLRQIALGWLAIAAASKAIDAGKGARDFLSVIGALGSKSGETAKGLDGVSRAILRLGEGETRIGPSMVQFTGDLAAAETTATRAKLALAGLGGALVTVGAVILASPLAKKLHDDLNGTSQDTTKLAEALNNLGESGKFNGALLKEFKGNVVTARDSIGTFQRDAKELVTPDVGAYVNHAFNSMFSWLPGVGNKVSELRGKFKDLDASLTQMVSQGQSDQAAAAFAQLSTQLSKAGISTEKINSLFPRYTTLVGSAAFQSQQFTQKINDENNALSRNAHLFADSQQEVIDFRQGLATATEGLKSNGKAFFGNSQQAIDNRARVLSVARTLQNYSDDLVANNNVTADNIKQLRGQRDQLVKLIEKFGVSKEKAEEYANQLVKIPKSVNTKLNVDAQGHFVMKGVTYPTTSNPFNLPGRAGGGLLDGVGGDRSDSIVARLSPREFVVNAPATRKYLPLLAAINDEGNRGTPYQGKGYAGGGLVHPDALPAFAGGGTFLDYGLLSAKTVLSGHLNYGYDRSGPPYGSALSKGTASVGTGTNESHEFSVKQAALAAVMAMGMLGAGGGAMVDLARTQIGVHEGPGNSQKYSHELGRPSEEWCADFIDWLALRTHNKPAIPWTASAPGMANQFGSRYVSGTAGAVPGDVVFFGPSKAGIYHVGLASGPAQGGTIPTIAGNHGDAVRAYTGTGIAGYAHPNYPNPGSGGGIGAVPGSLIHASPDGAKAWARQNLKDYGWGLDQFTPLERLWTRESGWRWNALNRSSGAYGIPQSLPASKMASAGSDWRDNAGTQIKWGLGYIAGRYHSPSGAWAHSQATGWYDSGGYLPPGYSVSYNGTGKPERLYTGHQVNQMGRGGDAATYQTTYNLHHRDITITQLEGLQRLQETRQRVGRAR